MTKSLKSSAAPDNVHHSQKINEFLRTDSRLLTLRLKVLGGRLLLPRADEKLDGLSLSVCKTECIMVNSNGITTMRHYNSIHVHSHIEFAALNEYASYLMSFMVY